MKAALRLCLLVVFLAGCGDNDPLRTDCPEHTDFTPCSDASGNLTGEATCYEAPPPDVAPAELVPVVGCAMPQYNIAACVESCR